MPGQIDDQQRCVGAVQRHADHAERTEELDSRDFGVDRVGGRCRAVGGQPDVLGTLILGESLDYALASQFSAQTNSEIAFAVNGEIKAATLPQNTWPVLTTPS